MKSDVPYCFQSRARACNSRRKSPKSSVITCRAQIHVFYDVFGVFQTSKQGNGAASRTESIKQLFIAVAVALLLNGLTRRAQHGLKCGGISQQPTLDVRIGNCVDDLSLNGFYDFLECFATGIGPMTIRIGRHDNEVRQPAVDNSGGL